MMRRIIQPCGLHCIKMHDIGVTIGEQTILENINLHIHCGTPVSYTHLDVYKRQS